MHHLFPFLHYVLRLLFSSLFIFFISFFLCSILLFIPLTLVPYLYFPSYFLLILAFASTSPCLTRAFLSSGFCLALDRMPSLLPLPRFRFTYLLLPSTSLSAALTPCTQSHISRLCIIPGNILRIEILRAYSFPALSPLGLLFPLSLSPVP